MSFGAEIDKFCLGFMMTKSKSSNHFYEFGDYSDYLNDSDIDHYINQLNHFSTYFTIAMYARMNNLKRFEERYEPQPQMGYSTVYLCIAIRYNSKDIVKYMLEVDGLGYHTKNRAFLVAVRHNRIEFVDMLQTLVNSRYHECRALQIACHYNHFPLVEILLENYYTVFDLTNRSIYALFRHGHYDLVTFAVEKTGNRELYNFANRHGYVSFGFFVGNRMAPKYLFNYHPNMRFFYALASAFFFTKPQNVELEKLKDNELFDPNVILLVCNFIF